MSAYRFVFQSVFWEKARGDHSDTWVNDGILQTHSIHLSKAMQCRCFQDAHRIVPLPFWKSYENETWEAGFFITRPHTDYRLSHNCPRTRPANTKQTPYSAAPASAWSPLNTLAALCLSAANTRLLVPRIPSLLPPLSFLPVLVPSVCSQPLLPIFVYFLVAFWLLPAMSHSPRRLPNPCSIANWVEWLS